MGYAPGALIPARELAIGNQYTASERCCCRSRNEAQDFAAAIIVSTTTWP
jgi:hypothetical protein